MKRSHIARRLQLIDRRLESMEGSLGVLYEEKEKDSYTAVRRTRRFSRCAVHGYAPRPGHP